MSDIPSKLLLNHLDLLIALDRSLPVLDLACGTGRDGLALAEQGMDVVFADKSVSALNVVEQSLLEAGLTLVNALHEASTAVPSCSRMIPAEHLKYSHRIISHRLSGQILNEFKIA